MTEAFICDAVRTPIGRYAGALAALRADDLAAIPLRALLDRNPHLDPGAIDDVYYGCVNQAGEDSRNVARMAALLAGLPDHIPAITLNRICASGLDSIASSARAIRCAEADLCLAGGVESVSRAPFVLSKADTAFPVALELYSSVGARFPNPLIESQYGADSYPETAENLAREHQISREDQDAYALQSQLRTARAQEAGFLTEEIVPVTVPRRKADPVVVDRDEAPRETSIEALARLPALFPEDGTVTAGNAAGLYDGACALIVASEAALKTHRLTPLARIVATAAAGVPPRIYGFGPVPATHKVLAMTGLSLWDFDAIEINETFAAHVLACTRALGLADDAPHLNPNGGAISLGHPPGMSGARIAASAVRELARIEGRYALVSLPVGLGQGAAMVLERV